MMGGIDGRGLAVDEKVRLGAKQVDCLGSGRVSSGDGVVDISLYDKMLIDSLMKVLMGVTVRWQTR